MNKILTLFILLIFGSIKSQSYKPIPLDANHYWTNVITATGGMNVLYCQTSTKQLIKDTLIQSVLYHKVYYGSPYPPMGNCYGADGTIALLRQDTIQKKVFIRFNNVDRLLYNFNKNINDTLMAFSMLGSVIGTTIILTVTQIDSVLLFDNQYHKRIKYNTSTPTFTVIEGVGGLKGLVIPYFDPFETFVDLLCMGTSSSNIIYSNPQYLWGCMPSFTGITPSLENAKSRFFPNPVSDELSIIEAEGLMFKMVNLLGKEVELVESGEKLNSIRKFNLECLPKGIYFLQVYQDNQLISVEKIIKE